ncbi:MAG: hypothetical protein HOA17_02760 [Candidatus Melainabacteria bacterium]|jgi:hypothetical protein|nr:hypothetical protein [Candidatus Melainabacteria bacterium]
MSHAINVASLAKQTRDYLLGGDLAQVHSRTKQLVTQIFKFPQMEEGELQQGKELRRAFHEVLAGVPAEQKSSLTKGMREFITAAGQNDAQKAGYKFFGSLANGNIRIVNEDRMTKQSKTMDIELLAGEYRIFYNFTNHKGELFHPIEAIIIKGAAPEDFKLIGNTLLTTMTVEA